MTYAAPEIVAPSTINGLPPKPCGGMPSDVWSLAICMHVVSTGCFPLVNGKCFSELSTGGTAAGTKLYGELFGTRDSLFYNRDELAIALEGFDNESREQFLDLLQAMTSMEAARRPMIREIIESDWLAGARDRRERLLHDSESLEAEA